MQLQGALRADDGTAAVIDPALVVGKGRKESDVHRGVLGAELDLGRELLRAHLGAGRVVPQVRRVHGLEVRAHVEREHHPQDGSERAHRLPRCFGVGTSSSSVPSMVSTVLPASSSTMRRKPPSDAMRSQRSMSAR